MLQLRHSSYQDRLASLLKHPSRLSASCRLLQLLLNLLHVHMGRSHVCARHASTPEHGSFEGVGETATCRRIRPKMPTIAKHVKQSNIECSRASRQQAKPNPGLRTSTCSTALLAEMPLFYARRLEESDRCDHAHISTCSLVCKSYICMFMYRPIVMRLPSRQLDRLLFSWIAG